MKTVRDHQREDELAALGVEAIITQELGTTTMTVVLDVAALDELAKIGRNIGDYDDGYEAGYEDGHEAARDALTEAMS